MKIPGNPNCPKAVRFAMPMFRNSLFGMFARTGTGGVTEVSNSTLPLPSGLSSGIAKS